MSRQGSAIPTGFEPIEIVVVLDFEATCIENGRIRPQEIIEFPAHIVIPKNSPTHSSLAHLDGREFHRYVRPVSHPVLTPFCTELTGITQDTVSSADTFPQVLRLFVQWLSYTIPADVHARSGWVMATCGDWDLKTCLPGQLKAVGFPSLKDVPFGYFGEKDQGGDSSPLSPSPTLPSEQVQSIASGLRRWVNVKHLFNEAMGGKTRIGMAGMLKTLRLPLIGRHHSGIDDTRNIAAIVRHVTEKRGVLINQSFVSSV